MIWLISAIAILLTGPLLYHLAKRIPFFLSAVDTLTIVAVTGLIFFLVMPHVIGHGGWLALIPAVIGFAGPYFLELILQQKIKQIHQSIVVILLVGLSIHAFLDGIALKVFSSTASGDELPLAIVLHRSADGLAIWKILKDDVWMAWAGLISLAIVTVLGYGLGSFIRFETGQVNLVYFEAFIAGTLLHVISHYDDNHSHV